MEAAPKDKSGADTRDLAAAPLLGSDITDDEGASPKENPLVTVAAPAKAITAGAVAVNVPKEKSAAGTYKASSVFSSAPLSLYKDPVSPLMAQEEDEPK